MIDLTFYRDVAVDALDAGDTFVDGDDLFCVDEVRRTRVELELLGYPSGRTTGKRIGKTYRRDEDRQVVRVVPDVECEAALLQLLPVTPLRNITAIDSGAVIGWSAPVDDRWRVMALAAKPASGKVIDVAEAADSVVNGQDIGLPDPAEEDFRRQRMADLQNLGR